MRIERFRLMARSNAYMANQHRFFKTNTNNKLKRDMNRKHEQEHINEWKACMAQMWLEIHDEIHSMRAGN